MALLFMDGFDHYASADILKKWTAQNGSSSITLINSTAGRRGGGALLAPSGSATTANVTKTLAASYATLIVGIAWKISAVSARNIMSVLDNGTAHLTLVMNSDSTLSIRRGTSAGTTLATSGSSLSLNTWYYIELKATIHDSTGAYEVRVNGSPWLSASNVDTRNGANASVNQVLLGSDGVLANVLTQTFDDLYICDTSGSAPQNDFLGDVRIDTVLPSADGTYTDFTPSTGTDHYALVDEATPSTSDYNESGTSGHQDSYVMQNVSSIPGTIFGVQVNVLAHKDDAGIRSLKVGVRSGTTDSVDAGLGLSESAIYYRNIFATDPDTTAAWTESGANAAEALVEVV